VKYVLESSSQVSYYIQWFICWHWSKSMGIWCATPPQAHPITAAGRSHDIILQRSPPHGGWSARCARINLMDKVVKAAGSDFDIISEKKANHNIDQGCCRLAL
jgi:hypothetical protein